MRIEEAFKFCENIARNHYENFPVGLFVPVKIRKYVYCIYAFARTADDIADNENNSTESRINDIDSFKKKLEACYGGTSDEPIFIALAETVKHFNIPIKPFSDLLFAFRMDITKDRHQTFGDLLYYSAHSANPIGRLILALSGTHDEKICSYSDRICTALQLTNFWQDITLDLAKNRIYIPLDEMLHFNYSEESLLKNEYNENFRNVMKNLISKTEKLFDEGKNLIPHLNGRLKFEIILTYLGGKLILKKIIKSDYNIYNHRPKIGNFDKISLLLKTFLLWLIPIKN
jgi:hydroxysqualene synthase